MNQVYPTLFVILAAHVVSGETTILDAPPIEAPDPSPTPSVGALPSPSVLPFPLPSPVPDENPLEFRAFAPRLRQGSLYCPCSFTTRSYNNATVLPEGHDALLSLGNESQSIYYACVREHGHEACVNWDAAVVFAGGSALCTADTITGSNVVDIGDGRVRTVGRCDEREDTTSPPESLGQFDTNGSLINITDIFMSPIPQLPTGGLGSLIEGCVAAEHLSGAGMLQHMFNWRRPVLCAFGFCATPNHAIIVDGEWTSLKELCSTKWVCTRSIKWVNNLSVFGSRSRRWKVGSASVNIEVTPYDVRIPVSITWMLQITELLAVSIVVVVLFFYTNSPDKVRYSLVKRNND